MTYERGAAWCLRRGIHRWRLLADGVEWCAECHATRAVADTISVNDLIDNGNLPQHARDEAEVDRLNDQRRRSRRGVW